MKILRCHTSDGAAKSHCYGHLKPLTILYVAWLCIEDHSAVDFCFVRWKHDINMYSVSFRKIVRPYMPCPLKVRPGRAADSSLNSSVAVMEG